ncbi:putative transcriptional regulator [Amylocarpus encephaloides]|uniref:Transcriptional regulator n=1 Tax=Amylocarpus encephaloides TaxID=45428 RepID=A0A9P8C712_9HELO|nr:putative transcriptional regulator [Amylocarpus encephaloides]
MYLRTAHAELHLPTLYNFVEKNPLGLLTTALPSKDHAFIQTSHIPFILDAPSSPLEYATEGSNEDLGILRAHVARANPQAKVLIENALALQDKTGDGGKNGTTLEQEVLILFNGPAHHYVTPKWYTTTKPDTGKVVSTWNYSAVQVYGKATILFDSKAPSTGAFLDRQLDDLATLTEEKIMGFDGKEGRKKPWTLKEAPESYVNILKKAIVGIEIRIERIQGKWKMSQELGDGDREGTIEGFKGMGGQVGMEIAGAIEERQKVKEGRGREKREKSGCPI